MKQVIATVEGVGYATGAVFSIPDGSGGAFKVALMPRRWMMLQPGDHFLIEAEIRYSDGMKYASEINCLYRCDEKGDPLYGRLTDEETEAAPVMSVVEKSEKGIKYKMPLLGSKWMISDFKKPSGWERVQVGEILATQLVESGYRLLTPLQ